MEAIVRIMIEWVGPGCFRKGIMKSMSGRTANRNSREVSTLMLNILRRLFLSGSPGRGVQQRT